MMEVITLSSKGQLVIPRGIREQMGLTRNDKFVLVTDKDSILIKKIREEDIQKRMKLLMRSVARDFKKAEIKEEDIDREIKAARAAE